MRLTPGYIHQGITVLKKNLNKNKQINKLFKYTFF